MTKPRAPSPFLDKRGALFHEDLVIILRTKLLFFKAAYLTLGRIILLPRVSGRWNIAMLHKDVFETE